MWLLYLLIMNYQTFTDKIVNFYYAFINGFFMMKTIPQIWIMMKMAFYGSVTMMVVFTIALAINGQMHQFWFTVFDTKIIIQFNSWYVIDIGSIILAGIIGFYVFRLSTYYYRKHKNKKNKL